MMVKVMAAAIARIHARGQPARPSDVTPSTTSARPSRLTLATLDSCLKVRFSFIEFFDFRAKIS